MQIEFTQREYKALLEMIYLADWMLHAHAEDTADDACTALGQKILARAREFGCGERVEFSIALQKYSLSSRFELSQRIQGAIEAYDGATFWAELVDRLSERDLLRAVGADRLAAMAPTERLRAYHDAECPYAEEFETHGLDRLKIDRGEQSDTSQSSRKSDEPGG